MGDTAAVGSRSLKNTPAALALTLPDWTFQPPGEILNLLAPIHLWRLPGYPGGSTVYLSPNGSIPTLMSYRFWISSLGPGQSFCTSENVLCEMKAVAREQGFAVKQTWVSEIVFDLIFQATSSPYGFVPLPTYKRGKFNHVKTQWRMA